MPSDGHVRADQKAHGALRVLPKSSTMRCCSTSLIPAVEGFELALASSFEVGSKVRSRRSQFRVAMRSVKTTRRSVESVGLPVQRARPPRDSAEQTPVVLGVVDVAADLFEREPVRAVPAAMSSFGGQGRVRRRPSRSCSRVTSLRCARPMVSMHAAGLEKSAFSRDTRKRSRRETVVPDGADPRRTDSVQSAERRRVIRVGFRIRRSLALPRPSSDAARPTRLPPGAMRNTCGGRPRCFGRRPVPDCCTSFLKRRITSPLSTKVLRRVVVRVRVMAVASSMLTRLAKLLARFPSWGVAESMMSVSDRCGRSRLASLLRSERVPRSATLCASSITMISQYACSRYVRYSASCLSVSMEMIDLS